MGKHISKAGAPHLKALTHILKYLNCTKFFKLHIGKLIGQPDFKKNFEERLDVYTDANFVRSGDYSRSGCVVLYEGS